MQKLTGIVILSVALLTSSGCSYFGVYKRDLPQGNLFTAAMVEQLERGMSRNEVVDVMGNPLLEAPFAANQWDYVYRLDEAYDGVLQRRVTLTFADDRLVEINRSGDFSGGVDPLLPDETAAGATATQPAPQPANTSPAPRGPSAPGSDY